MAQVCTITVRCSIAWWLRPYLAMLKVFVFVTRRMPSDAHIAAIARRAVRISPLDEA